MPKVLVTYGRRMHGINTQHQQQYQGSYMWVSNFVTSAIYWYLMSISRLENIWTPELLSWSKSFKIILMLGQYYRGVKVLVGSVNPNIVWKNSVYQMSTICWYQINMKSSLEGHDWCIKHQCKSNIFTNLIGCLPLPIRNYSWCW